MTASRQPDLRAKLMGPMTLETADGQSALPKGKKSRGLLAFLLFNHGKPIARPKLIDLFWSDRATEQGQASLRQALHEIRRTFDEVGVDRLEVSRDVLRISSNHVAFDLWNSDGHVVTDLTDLFLDGLDPVAPVFDDWLEETRRVIAATQLSQAEQDLSESERGGDPERISDRAQTVLKHDPANEPAARSLLRALAKMDKMSAVKTEFERLSRALADDGFELSGATVDLYDSLRKPASAAVRQSAATQRAGQLPVLAIIPTGQDFASPQDNIMADALAEECGERLAALPELRTIDPNALQATQIPPNPDCDYVLRCRISSQDAKKRCYLRVVDTRSDLVCWTSRETLDGDRFYEQLPALADRCVAGILAMIERTEMDHLAMRNETDYSAYDHYLKAKDLFFRADRSDYMTAVQNELELAIEKDPLFVPAYTHLIQSYNTSAFMTRPGLSAEPGRRRALDLAEKLLSINSQHANSHIAMAWCQMWKRNFPAAERSIDIAIDIGAYEAHRLNAIATALLYLGRQDEAERFYEQSQTRMIHDLDYQRSDYGELCYFRGDFDRALSWLDYGERRLPYRTLFWRSLVMAQLGRLPEAKEDIEALTENVAKRWASNQPCTADSALRWYLQMIPLKREVDKDLVLDGLAKVGYSF